MAIFPVRSNYVIDVDAFTSASYKAGMAIVRDDNGRAIVADSQQLVFKNIYQKSGKFLGFAASDHDVSGNTIIRPDVVGSSYLDSSYGYVQFKDNEFLSPKRALADNLDETASKFYNNTEILSTTRRGIGVYNQPGEIYITDQFVPVLHGDYGFDGLDTQTLNPGDLLTFGGGVNAGKLVKVNLNSLGPDVLVIGQVEKYVSQTRLLHFRLVNYSVSFGNNISIFYDAANNVSYPRSGTIWSNLASTSYNMTLVNGPSYSSANNGVMVFDGTDDNGTTSGLSFTNFTMEMFVNVYQLTGALALNRIVQTNSTYLTIVGQSFYGPLNTLSLFDSATGYNNTSYVVPLGQYIHLTLVKNGAAHEIFVNGVSVYSASLGNPTIGYILLADGGGNEKTRSSFGYFKIYNKVLTATEVLNSFNFNKSRFGL